MSAYFPAIIARKIAMLLRSSHFGVTSDKTRSWYTVSVGLLVAYDGSQMPDLPRGEARIFVDSLFPVVKDAVKTELIHRQATVWSDTHDILGVDPPVDVLAHVHLVGYDISEKRRVVAVIL